MYLEKLVVQGFKSFANKNELIFPGGMKEGKHGLTAVVGPNGSGKSNVADAIRWALGEQSMKTLRGKKSEDVIFAGSDKRGQLGMAEVSLYLNNHDGKTSIDYSDVVLTRRLYRDGNSEYLINGSRVRLFEVQMLLAKANFGQKTYSVIGQGMVEGFLNTSLAERKEFFDEATGVKQYQIKREEALNKLKTSLENLGQSQMLVAEIEPRLRTLSKQMARLEKKGQLIEELDYLQLNYYSHNWQEINNKLHAVQADVADLESQLKDKQVETEKLEAELSSISGEETVNDEFEKYQSQLTESQSEKLRLEKYLETLRSWLELAKNSAASQELQMLEAERVKLSASLDEAKAALSAAYAGPDRRGEIAEMGNEIQKLERDRSDLLRELHRLDAWIEMKLEAAGQFDLAFLNNRQGELKTLVENIDKEFVEIELLVAGREEKIKNLLSEKESLATRIKELNDEWRQVSSIGDSVIVREVNGRLEKSLAKLEEAERENDLVRIRAALVEIREELSQALSFATGRDTAKKLELLREQLDETSVRREKIASEHNAVQLEINTAKEKRRILNNQKEQANRELADIEGKIKKGQEKFDAGAAKDERDGVNSKQNTLAEKIAKLQSELNELRLADEKKRQAVNAARSAVENSERELNRTANRINDIKISAARVEARREDLERDIRRNRADILFEVEIITTEYSSVGEKIKTIIATIENARVKLAEFNAAQEAKRRKLLDLQRALQAASNDSNRLNNRLNELKMNAVRHETRLEDLEVEIHENYDHLEHLQKHQVSETFDVYDAGGKIKNIKRQLEQIGSIDEDSEKEYMETKERFEFLNSQVTDLNDTIKSLEEVIKELDETIRERFDREFKTIADKFEEYFKILFNGGNAKIIKVMSDELAEAEGETAENPNNQDESITAQTLKKIKALQRINATGLAGIEIMATPPGKKIKSIQMLSGGERALTAIALICAIISANPSPFVVLDEVDAALDEANSERLARILDDLSEKTQFIVITHNRAPMRKAAILYGVTMQEDGISKLLSVKLEDVKLENR